MRLDEKRGFLWFVLSLMTVSTVGVVVGTVGEVLTK